MKVFHQGTQQEYVIPDHVYRNGGGLAATEWIDTLIRVESSKAAAKERSAIEELQKQQEEEARIEAERLSKMPTEIELLKGKVDLLMGQNKKLTDQLMESQDRVSEYFNLVTQLRGQLEPTSGDRERQAAEIELINARKERNRAIFEQIRQGETVNEQLLYEESQGNEDLQGSGSPPADG